MAAWNPNDYRKITQIFESDNVDEFQHYLDQGNDPNGKIQYSPLLSQPQYPLNLAIFYNARKIFDLLLSDPRIDVNIMDSFTFRSPLMMAIVYVHPYYVRRLLEKGADINIYHNGQEINTPLSMAVSHHAFFEYSSRETKKNELAEIVQILISFGADVNQPFNINQERPLHKVASTGYMPIMNVLLMTPGIDLNVQDIKGMTPLMDAVVHHKLEAVEALLAAGANVNILAKFGDSALFWALINPIFYFQNEENRDIVRKIVSILLVSMDKSILNTENDRGEAPIHLAAKNYDGWMVYILLYNGADPNQRGDRRETPLMVAAAPRKLETVKILISAGADVNLLDKNNESALSYALISYLHYQSNQDREAIRNIVHILLLHTDIKTLNTENKIYKRTPLHVAAMHYDYWMVATLLQSGADPTLSDAFGNRPSWLAFKAGKTREAELILQYEYGIIP